MGTTKSGGGGEQALRQCLAMLQRTLPGPDFAPALRRFVFLYLLDQGGWLPFTPGRLWQFLPATAAGEADGVHFDRHLLRPTCRRWLGDAAGEGPAVPDRLCRTWLENCDAWEWTLTEAPHDDRIGPALLGALCEREQDRKGQGVYFTSPDVTRYICANVLFPAVLDRFAESLGRPRGSLPLAGLPGWRLPPGPDRYLRAAAGSPWPGETDRERQARRLWIAGCRRAWTAGEIGTASDFITWNLDLSRLMIDWIAGCRSPEVVDLFLHSALEGLKVLDPTCGSGAFLLGALDLLQPLYLACLTRLRQFAGERPGSRNATAPAALQDDGELAGPPDRWAARVARTILEQNLYGVDRSPAAIEACRMRLVLRVLADFARPPAHSTTVTELPPVSGRDLALHSADILDGTLPWPEGAADGRGFDAVVGNPPYVAYGARGPYHGLGYATERCENLYALVCERALRLAGPGGRLGVIVPISSLSLPGFRPLADRLRRQDCWISTYSNRPAKLFPGVEQRLAIWLTSPSPAPTTRVSPYQHWYEYERPHLFDRLRYTPASEWPETGMPIKSGDPLAESIFHKLLRHQGRLSDLAQDGESAVWLHDGPTYWVRALPFPPNPDAPRPAEGHYHRIPVADSHQAYLLAALLGSTTFYFFFKMVSNCRDLGRKEWAAFPLDPVPDALQEALAGCGKRLAERLQTSARTRTRRYPSGLVEYREYYPAQAKEILAEIDRLLARHYHLTDDERDYLIHYDEKYRMGQNHA